MTGQVQLRSFHLSTDHTEIPESALKNPKESDSLFDGRFRATNVWNKIIRRFRSGMPVKRHLRQLRIFENCFTGREAVDFMMNELPKIIHDGREITRFNCSKLLGIYMNMELFRSVRGKCDDNEEFKENELYR
ncbi:unnamed protein product [Onchocerca flexuosa]|uniref:DEP domain-containing protein n=1 Tax=Onchocerca flexuosa TaxID=387005 RepID=A0A183I854_9BILA|nr:unnamed protein product [Onchocerca flexuosa]